MKASEHAFQERLGLLCDVIEKDKTPNANAWMQALIEMLASGIGLYAKDEAQRAKMVDDACKDLAERSGYYRDKNTSNVVRLPVEGKKR